MATNRREDCNDGTCTCNADSQFIVSPEDVNRNRVMVDLPPMSNPPMFTVHRHDDNEEV